jgi:Flp pilus assembly protein TadD
MNLPTVTSSNTTVENSSPGFANPLVAKIAVALSLLTFIIFLPVVKCEFVDYDDDVFVTANEKVAPGFTWEGIKWAFTSADIDYWRPLSWLSHMLDLELFGSVAGGHHLSNLLIHCGAVVMAFLAIHRLSGALWPSAIVAALFAWHPLHVESVAWVAERKDVLCGFFFFFALWAYRAYVDKPGPRTYLTVFAGFLLGIMSKPMIVTLPCVLLLLDFWPLRRCDPFGVGGGKSSRIDWPALWVLVKEKLPFFGVVLVLAISTIYSQHRVGTLADIGGVPLPWRLQTSTAAYGTYLAQTFFPVNLCVLYPLPPGLPVAKWLPAAMLLSLVTGFCLLQARRRPYLITGWLWFLGMLVPVIGLVQVGEQAHADRYTYLPLTGIFIMLVWLGSESAHGARAKWVTAIGIASLLLCAGLTRHQLAFWENGITVFSRAARLTEPNPTAYNNWGVALRLRTRFEESIPVLEEALRQGAGQAALFNIALSHGQTANEAMGLSYMTRAFGKAPRSRTAREVYDSIQRDAHEEPTVPLHRKYLAIGQAARTNFIEAAEHLAAAALLAPTDINIRVDQAAYLAAAGRDTNAIQVLRDAVALAPTNALAQANLGALLAKRGHSEEALSHYTLALALDAENPHTRHNYALLLSRAGRAIEAKQEFEQVLRINSRYWPTMQQLAWLLATRDQCRDGAAAERHIGNAMKIVGKTQPALVDVLAAAQAAQGKYDLAIHNAEEALRLIQSGKHYQPELAEAIRARIGEYQSMRPHTIPASKAQK